MSFSIAFCGDGHLDKQAGSSLLVFHHYVWSVCFYVFVGLDWHVPKYSRCLVFCHSSWFMFVVFISYFDVVVFAYCQEEEICYSFIVSLYVLCLGEFRASGDKVIKCFLKLPTDFAHSVGAIFQYLVSVVFGLNALFLGSNNETFCF